MKAEKKQFEGRGKKMDEILMATGGEILIGMVGIPKDEKERMLIENGISDIEEDMDDPDQGIEANGGKARPD